MSKSFEERLERLERIVAEMHNNNPRRGPGRDDWRSTIGMFAGDPQAKEIIDEALRLRDEERRQVNQ